MPGPPAGAALDAQANRDVNGNVLRAAHVDLRRDQPPGVEVGAHAPQEERMSATTVKIGKRIQQTIKPKFIRIAGYWYPRGGMPIDVFWQSGKLSSGVWLPDTGVSSYRGRG